MTLSTSCVLASASNNGLRTPDAPTSASTAVPPRAGFGAVATGWHASSTTAAATMAAARRLLRMSRHPDVGQGAHQEPRSEDPGRPVDLPLETAAGSIPSAESTVSAADRPAQSTGLRRLNEHSRHQEDGEDGL